MKILLALLLISSVLLGFAIAEQTKEEVNNVISESSSNGYKSDKDVSILDTVKYIKSRKYARSLQAVGDGLEALKSENDPMLSFYQFCIWVPIGLFLILFFAIMALFYMDADKEKDTLIYAKFLPNYK